MTGKNGTGAAAAWMARAAGSRPEGEAIRWEGGALRYGELYARSETLALRLAREMPQGAVLAVRLDRRWQTALALYAALRLGVPLLPLDPRLPLGVQGRLCDRVAPCILLSGQPAESALPVAGRLPAELLLQDDEAAGGPPLPMPAADAIQLIIPTSGSEGEPKAAMLSGANLAAAVRASRQRIPLGPEDCWLDCLPLFHIGGISILLRCLEAGSGVLLQEGFDAAAAWREIAGGGVTHVSLVPAMLQQILQCAGDSPAPPRLRSVLVGGAALDPGLARRAREAGWPLCVSYGMSEACSQVATRCGGGAGVEAGRVGRPLAGFELRIAGADRHGVGRIRLRGPALMAGYAAPGLEPGLGLVDGWLESGDLGRLDGDGELWVLGRADDVLVSGGEKIHPNRVEPVLRSCPGVGAAALTARDDPEWGDRLVALYVGDAEPQRLEAHCRERLQGAARPREYLRLESLPLGASGKLDRRALRRLVQKQGA